MWATESWQLVAWGARKNTVGFLIVPGTQLFPLEKKKPTTVYVCLCTWMSACVCGDSQRSAEGTGSLAGRVTAMNHLKWVLGIELWCSWLLGHLSSPSSCLFGHTRHTKVLSCLNAIRYTQFLILFPLFDF